MRVIAVVNQKGGVGKTTTVVNLGHALSRRGLRVVLVDLDPQGHLSASLGIFGEPAGGVGEALMGGRPLRAQAIAAHDWGSLVPCGNDLGGKQDSLAPVVGPVQDPTRLRELIDAEGLDCDILLIDCPPSDGVLTINAVVAADDILIPVAGDYLSLTGLARVMLTLKRLAPISRPALRHRIFMSRYVGRRRLAREVRERIGGHFSDKLLPASIGESAVLAECAGAGKTIFEYRENSESARQFLRLADDLLHNRVAANEQEETSHVA